VRNNRIATSKSLNQPCVSRADVERQKTKTPTRGAADEVLSKGVVETRGLRARDGLLDPVEKAGHD
jgi:hypothetical protein